MRKFQEMQRFYSCEFIIILMIILLYVQLTDSIKKGRGKGPRWWGLAHSSEMSNYILDNRQTNSIVGGGFNGISLTLRKKQKRLIAENPGILYAISKGMRMAITECQHQFRDRRWNCPTPDYMKGKGIFGEIIQTGCRETAFVYAIISAGVAHSIARACSEGMIETCTCDYRNNRRANGYDWEWGGCSDNIETGYRLTREFVDAAEKGSDIHYTMNLHNNEAGRLHVSHEMRRECKCHGMSGSCTVKTCWMKLPSFREVGTRLKDRFDGASKVLLPNRMSKLNNGKHMKRNIIKKRKRKLRYRLKPYDPSHKLPTEKDLVYFDNSPDFCLPNPKYNFYGTRGRVCNASSIGVDGCELMCCGRGYRTEIREEYERCNCTFQWCCNVHCKICKRKRTYHTCL